MVFDGLFWETRTRLRSFEVHLRLLVVNCWPLGVNFGLNESILGLRVDILGISESFRAMEVNFNFIV